MKKGLISSLKQERGENMKITAIFFIAAIAVLVVDLLVIPPQSSAAFYVFLGFLALGAACFASTVWKQLQINKIMN